MKLNVQRADPAGNITVFVLDPVPLGDRAGISLRLMKELSAEQVAFVCPPRQGGDGRMEMMGGEFCGNAARAFGMLIARNQGHPSQVRVETSGCEHLVTVDIDWTAGTARAQMPLPRAVGRTAVDGHMGTLVDLVGIAHFVVEDVPPSLEFFERVEPLFWDIPDLEAYGVIFLDSTEGTMTPLVKVPAADTLVWEGSCGSGSLAAAIAQSQDAPNGPFVRSYLQPAGTVEATVIRRDGEEVSASIGGPVTLDPPVEVQLSDISGRRT